MAKKKKEEVLEVVEETTQEVNQQDPGDENVVQVDESKFDSAGDSDVVKVDLDSPPVENIVEETDETVSKETEEAKEESTNIVEEITELDSEEQEANVEATAEAVEEAITESMETGNPLPENIQKLMDFMNDTGGSLEDYVSLNYDYSETDDATLLKEYYRKTKPHLNTEEINFLMEDQFSYDEEVDDERDIKRKKLALKEQVAGARTQLEELKSKYYEDIKAGSKLTSDQQKAINFFDRYKHDSEKTEKRNKANQAAFKNETNQIFNDKFKGFEYNVGDKKFRYNVKDVDTVKENQSDLSNFVRKFLNKKTNQIGDAAGYHKSLFTANNPDAVATHFYEQGRADALRESITKSKNINMDPRQSHKEVDSGGLKFKVLGDTTADFKFKIDNRK